LKPRGKSFMGWEEKEHHERLSGKKESVASNKEERKRGSKLARPLRGEEGGGEGPFSPSKRRETAEGLKKKKEGSGFC